MAVTWNSGDKSANVTLSGGSLAATTSSNTQGGCRATSSFSSGKLYYEASITGNNASTACGLGWANATASLAASLGVNTNSVAGLTSSPSNILFNNSALGNLGRAAGTPGDIMRIAFDITGKLIWVAYGEGLWNGSTSANPGTGTGGLSVSTIAAGPYFPAFCSNLSAFAITANFGATPFNFAIPAGFSAVDPSTQAYEAASKMLGYAVEAPPTDAMSAAKLLGYAVEGTPNNAMSASKLIGYAVTVSQKLSYSRQTQYTYIRE